MARTKIPKWAFPNPYYTCLPISRSQSLNISKPQLSSGVSSFSLSLSPTPSLLLMQLTVVSTSAQGDKLGGMEALGSVDDLLDFSLDIGEEDEDEDKTRKTFPSLNPKCSDQPSFNPLDQGDPNRSFSEFAEEELEWLSNKDAFPAVETFVDIPSIQPDISKLEYSTSSSNSNNSTNSITLLNGYDHLKVPVRARSKCRSRRRPGIADISSQQFWWRQPSNEIAKAEEVIKISSIGRKCQHCGAEKTPQWRAGPHGPKTLCNACGVRFKSGRLVPEYRPASSPTFRSELHSNSHRKIMEMRRQKQMGMV